MSDSLQSEIAKRWLDLMESVRKARSKGLTVAYEAISEDGRRYVSVLCPEKGCLTLSEKRITVVGTGVGEGWAHEIQFVDTGNIGL